MPDGGETISKIKMEIYGRCPQREEDILLQEFECRIAYSKFQIASFIKTHIFSRRRPVDGGKYMIEVVGPNAKRGKGSVSLEYPVYLIPLPSHSRRRGLQLIRITFPLREGSMGQVFNSILFYCAEIVHSKDWRIEGQLPAS
ncbi:hypothetical protein SESBI_12249 [Sesbania bispinosa]|nr:hypothetical protein SESBI_12249 [Sesbania bispinosa]